MADVKFSELTALAAATVDAADVLAIVDTSASTSKKLSIDNLFGAVPVNIAVADATDSGSISTGSIQTAGGIGVTKALSVGTTSTFTGNILPAASGTVDIGSASAEINDMFFSTGSVLNFGDGQEVTVTAATTGLTVGSTKKLMFGDAASFIHQSADSVLTVDGEATIDLNASTAVLVSNDLKLDSDAAVLGFGVNNDVTLTHVADTALMLNAAMQLRFRDAAINIGSSTDGQMEIAADTEVQIDTTTVDLNGILDVSGASTLTGVVTVAAGIIADAQDGAYLGSSTRQFSDLFLADEAVIAFGDDGDVTLTHVLDTGLLLSDDSGVGTTQLQFGDAGTYVHQSADGALDLVSDGSINATVGAAGMVLKGTTPKLTIGDAGAEDTFIVFDGNAQDYRIGLDDGTDILEMGVGAAHGTTPSVKLSSDLSVDIAGHNGTVGLKLGGTVVGSTAAELNLLDGSAKSTASITIADADAFIVIDGSTTKQIPASDLETYLESSLDTLTSVTAVGTLTGLTVSGAIIPNASGTVSLGSASAEWNDMFFSTASVLNFGDAQDMTLTHDATNGLTVNSTKKFMFGAATEFVHGSGSTTLALGAATAITATTPTVTFAAAGADQVIKHGTDVYDLAFQQTDGNEVARIHDGATAATLETTALDLTAGAAGKGGFGFKRPVYNVTAGSDDADCLLAMKHSGAMIMVTGSAYDMDIILPVIAAGDEGWHVTIAVTTAFSGTNNLEIATNGHGDATDRIYLYMNTAGTSGAEATSSDDVVKFVDDVAAGTLCRMTCVKGGTNEVWIAEVLQPAGTAATTTAAVA